MERLPGPVVVALTLHTPVFFLFAPKVKRRLQAEQGHKGKGTQTYL